MNLFSDFFPEIFTVEILIGLIWVKKKMKNFCKKKLLNYFSSEATARRSRRNEK
jgi:hypothetical protein